MPHRGGPADAGQLEPGVRRAAPQRLSDADRADDGLLAEVVDDPSALPPGDEGLDHRVQPALGQGVDGLGAGLQGRGTGRVCVVDAGEHLAAIEVGGLDALGVVGAEAVVHLEGGPLEADPVHGAPHELAVQSAQERQVLDDLGGSQEPVDAGAGQRRHAALEEVLSVGHRQGPLAGSQGPAGRVIAGDDHEAPGPGQFGAGALGQGPADTTGVGGPDLGDGVRQWPGTAAGGGTGGCSGSVDRAHRGLLTGPSGPGRPRRGGRA